MNLKEFLAEHNYCVIDLEKNSSGHYQLRASIDNIEGDFILDTGASTSCLGMRFCDKFGLNMTESDLKAAGAGAVNMITYKAEIKSFSIGNSVSKMKSIVIFDFDDINTALEMENSSGVDGIIGADFLEEKKAVISYFDRKLFLKR